MQSVLVVYVLSIQSSYAEDSEAPADDDTFDTVQFFIGPESAWRIRTFSVDEDVHVYSLGPTQPETLDKVCDSTEKTYGDVVAAKHVFSSDEGIDGLKKELATSVLGASVKESKQHGFCFWVPEGSDYQTRSTPES
ncbi:hypothetical protein [Povalibacter sp.]|uniref:hypothetical protein n=1 Tax=Povalibacter sp. TaxID=1962978 RepID=UPI002F406570